MANIVEIEGVGSVFAEKLAAAGVSSVEKLLEAGGTKKGRQDLAKKTGIGESNLLKWVNHADLFRVKGVAGEYAELLEAAGVDSVPELAQRRAQNLHQKMAEVNGQKKLVRALPSETQVQDWIEQAKHLPRKVSH